MERFENATKSGSHYNAAVPGRVLLVVRTNEGCFYFGSRLTFMVWIWVMLGFVVVPTSSMSALSAFQVPATNLRSSRWYPSSSPTLSPTLTRSATRTTSTVLLHQVSDASSSIEDNDKASNKPKPKRPNQQQQRRDRVSIPSLRDWATSEAIGIKLAPSSRVFLEANEGSGIGWYFTPTTTTNTTTSETKNQNSVLVSVPSTIPLTVECPGEGPDDTTVFSSLLQQQNGGMEKETNEEWLALPWYVQMALYLVKLDRVDSTKKGKQNTGARAIDYRPWLDSLPRQFDTPLHWPTATLENDLQYTHMTLAVTRQRKQWQRHFTKVTKLLSQTQSNGTRTAASTPCITWDDFCWGSECARSRAFAGTYTGQAFQLPIYAFTLLLVTVYVGLGLGSLEQAANGAGLVVAASILKGM